MQSSALKPTVFVVDDDASVRRALCRLLRSFDMPVVAFASADEFLATKRPAGRACLVLDMRMPVMNGLALQQHIHDLHQDLPVVMITGHGDEKVRRRSRELGAVAVLLKPFEDEELLAAIELAFKDQGE